MPATSNHHKTATCPPWCQGHVPWLGPDDDHVATGIDVPLSLLPQIEVGGTEFHLAPDYMNVCAWHKAGEAAPHVYMRHSDDDVASMTPAEALRLAAALARAAFQADPQAVAGLEVPAPAGFDCPPWCDSGDHHRSPDDFHLSTGPGVRPAREDHHCAYTTGEFAEPTCTEPVGAGLVYEPGTGPVTVEMYHGDDILPRLTPAGAATFALGLLAQILDAAADGGDQR